MFFIYTKFKKINSVIKIATKDDLSAHQGGDSSKIFQSYKKNRKQEKNNRKNQ
jgi:hypothetical protein